MSRFWARCAAAILCAALATTGFAQGNFTLTSSEITDGGALPSTLKCTRDGGDGLSPPLAWSPLPEGTQSLAVIMHHYPRGAVAGRDVPSQYWLLWNIPADTRAIDRGNPQSIGDEGSDKDARQTGYTPPCSPPGAVHDYTITVYALNAPLADLPQNDDISVDWAVITASMVDKVIDSAQITFTN